MRKTIYLPDDLAAQVSEYLERHQGLTFSALVQEALERELAPPDLRGLLDLAVFARVARVASRRATQIRYPDAEDRARAASTGQQMMSTCNASLEDVLLARTACAVRFPLWTMNYRDFTAFRDLPFWHPR